MEDDTAVDPVRSGGGASAGWAAGAAALRSTVDCGVCMRRPNSVSGRRLKRSSETLDCTVQLLYCTLYIVHTLQGTHLAQYCTSNVLYITVHYTLLQLHSSLEKTIESRLSSIKYSSYCTT